MSNCLDISSLFTPPVNAKLVNNTLVGKYLVETEFHSYPSNYTCAQVVYEYDLPDPYRIIHPRDGITRDLMPSRLNLFVTDYSVIQNTGYF
ncbi:hypothetical protein AX774_g1490 [Zancudomyces culisetae]|uniref:Uncharacterized protein n=1 Tax=Zancudomyces culisetae TaxID=1213189 RepID=A0A1R1PVL3_ZANCU|nr:hypothetical protein AX774_g1490 [Zancudomyces culisetae]|eukprot:OMH84981.1 hypothetical protein AX774_g1490 [Zancudomyces culisetae]